MRLIRKLLRCPGQRKNVTQIKINIPQFYYQISKPFCTQGLEPEEACIDFSLLLMQNVNKEELGQNFEQTWGMFNQLLLTMVAILLLF